MTKKNSVILLYQHELQGDQIQHENQTLIDDAINSGVNKGKVKFWLH